MAIFYHGSSVLFTRFDLSHVLEGDGKVKFGYGVDDHLPVVKFPLRSFEEYDMPFIEAIEHY